jgi:hypothetical protein
MPYTELLGWKKYFESRPVGWREDDRTAKLMQTFGCDKRPQEIFASLIPIYEEVSKPKVSDGHMSVSSLQGSWLFNKMMSARGGDKLDVIKEVKDESKRT